MALGSQKAAREKVVYPYLRFQQQISLHLSLMQVASFTKQKKEGFVDSASERLFKSDFGGNTLQFQT
jgi:hypothetical protein